MGMQTNSAVLTELETSIRSGSAVQNADNLRRITDLFLAGAEHYSEQQVSLFDDIFARLIERIETRALAELSERLARIENAPPGLTRRLAGDDAIAIAAPVLTQSARLNDSDLAAVARSKRQDHLLAVSRRETVNPPVTDILIERGNSDVLQSLAGNAGARMSEAGYAQLIERGESDAALLELVASRGDITIISLRRLLKRATKDVCARLLTRVGPDFKQDVHETLLRIFDWVDNDLHHQRDTALLAAKGLHAERRLDAKCIFEFCRTEQLAHMTAGLAFLSGASFELVADIIDSGRNPPLMVACKAADIPWSLTFAILKSRPHQHDIVEFLFDQLLSDYCRLTQATARRALQVWEGRRADGFLDDMSVAEPQRKARAFPRSKVHQAALILSAGRPDTPCTMLDISRGGAKLETTAATDVPDHFILTLARNRLIRRDCTVVWRGSTSLARRTLGVSFTH